MTENMKMYFPVEDGSWSGATGEWLWVTAQGNNRYRVENNPIFLYNISYHDVVSATTTPDGNLHFTNVVEKGGHSLYRVMLNDGVKKQEFLNRWSKFEDIGCSFESCSDPDYLFAIDVPPDVDVFAVHRLLVDGFAAELWDFEEPSFQHKKDGTAVS